MFRARFYARIMGEEIGKDGAICRSHWFLITVGCDVYGADGQGCRENPLVGGMCSLQFFRKYLILMM